MNKNIKPDMDLKAVPTDVSKFPRREPFKGEHQHVEKVREPRPYRSHLKRCPNCQD